MIEILDDLDVLARPDVDLSMLSLAGVRYGARADAIDRRRVVEVTLAPIVHRMIGGTGRETEYYGEDGRRLSSDEVIDSVIEADGALHYAEKFSYRVVGGVVAGFALYGGARGVMNHFRYLRSYDEFIDVFGKPERVRESYDTGELMGYYNYYRGGSKFFFWDTWDTLLQSANLGVRWPLAG